MIDLSTPLLPVREGVVVLPLVGYSDDKRGEEIVATLLDGISQQRSRIVILDITGIVTVDTKRIWIYRKRSF